MQLLTKFTEIFRNTPGFVRSRSHLSCRRTFAELTNGLRRELYSLGKREQLVARQVISKAGQIVTVNRDTPVFGKKRIPRHLERGSLVKISENPLRFGPEGDVEVIVLGQSDKYLFIKIYDYIRGIHVDHQ